MTLLASQSIPTWNRIVGWLKECKACVNLLLNAQVVGFRRGSRPCVPSRDLFESGEPVAASRRQIGPGAIWRFPLLAASFIPQSEEPHSIVIENVSLLLLC